MTVQKSGELALTDKDFRATHRGVEIGAVLRWAPQADGTLRVTA